MNRLKELIIMEMGYFKQKIYEISEDPKFSLEKINEEVLTQDEAKIERHFEKFIERLTKTKRNKSI